MEDELSRWASGSKWLEFDDDSIEKATADLESRGYRILVKNRKEPWGQTVTRLISPERLLVGVTFTAWMRKEIVQGACNRGGGVDFAIQAVGERLLPDQANLKTAGS